MIKYSVFITVLGARGRGMYSFFAEELVFANIGLQKEDIVLYTVTDSTNTRAREFFLENQNSVPKLFVAEEQTQGKGTRGRSFESKPGGLYLSILFSSESEDYDPSKITPIAAAATYAAIRSALGKKHKRRLFIKWVNDVYIDNKKISGILCEKITANGKTGYVIGIGVNLYGSDFSPEVERVAASVERMTGIKADKTKLCRDILAELIPALTSPKKTKLCRVYRKNSLKRGAEILVTDSLGNTREAKVIGLDSDFHLRVRYKDGGRAALISGDVSIKFR